MIIQKTGATTPSEKFSARLSIAARATPASSRGSVSRPTSCDAAFRALLIPSFSSASATRATCWYRLRWAINVLARMPTPIIPNGRIRSARSMTRAAAATIATTSKTVITPSICLRPGPALPSFQRRSNVEMKRPIQITGWPIDRNSQSG